MKTPNEYIEKIKVNKANFQHIAETGNINGTLLVDLIRLISEVKNDALLSTKEEKEEKYTQEFLEWRNKYFDYDPVIFEYQTKQRHNYYSREALERKFSKAMRESPFSTPSKD